MKSIAQIAAELAGYDPQALHADQVNAFLQALVQPVEGTQEIGIFEALGRVLAADANGIVVACGEGALRLLELQRPGGKRLPASAFLQGHRVAPGMAFDTPAN